MLMFTQTE